MMFNMSDELRAGDERAFEALLYCITHNVCVSGDCVRWLVNNHPELISDEYYADFEDSSRWSIAKAYILALDKGFYRCWEDVGLTEMQENEWWDQTLEPVHMKEVIVSTWVTDEEDM
jgi:hypothetical protein